MLKKYWILFFLLLLPFTGVRAQGDFRLATLEVDLWPEYDRPSVLVIYHLTLSPQAQLPAEITLRIPSAAGSPNAVAARQPDGRLVNLTYTQQPIAGEDWTELTLTATTLEIQLEYYDPQLEKDGTARSFEFQWPGDYGVDAVSIQVQQPFDATQMQISPSLGEGQTGQDGLVYYTSSLGSLAGGQSFSLRFDYQKPTETLSESAVNVEPSAPIESGAGRTGLPSALPWILGGLGLLLIVGGGWWYWQSGRRKAPAARRSRRKPSGDQETAAPSAEGHIYCHQCGKRASAGDRFCRTCGAPLRSG